MSANAARDVADALRAIRAKAAGEAPQAACRAMGDEATAAIKAALTATQHDKGTPTPSAKGQPPSKISGDLAGSVRTVMPAFLVAPGVSRCAVGSRLIYAPVHEHGPVTITARRFPQLGNPESGFFGRQVIIPRRPYIGPTVEKLITAGALQRAAVDAWRAVIDI